MKRWNELARSSIEQAGCIIVLLVFVIISVASGNRERNTNAAISGDIIVFLFQSSYHGKVSLLLLSLEALSDNLPISHISERKTSDNVNKASRKLENSELTIIYDKAAEVFAEFKDIVCSLDG